MTADDLIAKGISHQGSGEYGEAAEAFTSAFVLAPKDSRLPWEAARLYLYHLQEPAKAVQWFEASLPLLDEEAPFKACDTRYQLGLAHVFLSQDDQAKARFEEVLQHTGTHVLACLELGKLCARRGDYARAKDLLQQAVLHNNMRSTLPEMFPDGQRGSAHAAALAWLNLGRLALVTLDGKDEWEQIGANAAEQLIEELDDAQRVMLLAKEARAAGSLNGVMVALEQLLAREPDHEEASAMWFEVALDELEQFEQVVDMAESLVEEEPDRAARFLAEILKRQPDREDALAVQKQLRAEPGDGDRAG